MEDMYMANTETLVQGQEVPGGDGELAGRGAAAGAGRRGGAAQGGGPDGDGRAAGGDSPRQEHRQARSVHHHNPWSAQLVNE